MQNLINLQQFSGSFSPLMLVFVAWSIAWKGFALWKAGRNNSPVWFVVLLLVNTAGLLDIIYLFVIKNKDTKIENTTPTPIPNTSENIKNEIEENKTEEIKQETNQ